MDANDIAYAIGLFFLPVAIIIYLVVVDRRSDAEYRRRQQERMAQEEAWKQMTDTDREWLASWGSRWDDDD